jgi:phosphoribosylanthranilate isomerase
MAAEMGENAATGMGAAYRCRVKICGIRRPEDVEYANRCLPDYIGFVFADSPRRVRAREAAALKRGLDRRILSVGVFADADVGEPARLCADGVIDLVQLHGDEDEAYMRRLSELIPNPLIKAVRVCAPPGGAGGPTCGSAPQTAGGLRQAAHMPQAVCPPAAVCGAQAASRRLPASHAQPADRASPTSCPPREDCLLPADYLLFDAWHPRLRGGSGARFDWEGFRETAAGAGKPFFLAGGLDPGNAAAAMRLLRPYALDVSSGVETGGAKDYAKMSAFVRAVRDA